MSDRSRWLTSADWLAAHLADPDLVVVDGSWHLPTMGRNGRREYDGIHIPGAVFFDIDAIADTSNPLPHMLPSAETFAAMVGALGIDEKQKIVAYDTLGFYSAPRVWWTFKVMGARDVTVLDGGLPKWLAEGRPTDAERVARAPRTFHATLDPRVTVDLAGVRNGIAAGQLQLIDARPAARFRGEAVEPRPNVRSGHVPGSLSLPATEVIADGRLRDAAELNRAFAVAGVAFDKPIATSCGSGVNAAILNLALETLGVKGSRLYDGSWTEWGGRSDTDVATGR